MFCKRSPFLDACGHLKRNFSKMETKADKCGQKKTIKSDTRGGRNFTNGFFCTFSNENGYVRTRPEWLHTRVSPTRDSPTRDSPTRWKVIYHLSYCTNYCYLLHF